MSDLYPITFIADKIIRNISKCVTVMQLEGTEQWSKQLLSRYPASYKAFVIDEINLAIYNKKNELKKLVK